MSWRRNYRRFFIRWKKAAVLLRGFLHLTCSPLFMKYVLRYPLEKVLYRPTEPDMSPIQFRVARVDTVTVRNSARPRLGTALIEQSKEDQDIEKGN